MPNGQITVPEQLRERFRLLPETEVEVEAETEGSAARVLKARNPAGETRGQRLARLAWGSATDRSMTTDEIMAMTRGEE
jgi:bifunctional DNA-binding transcriptional regulator/antitoxin component of YhaV-PrlF toxin-antitoxin module